MSDDIVERARRRAAAFGVPKVSSVSETGTLVLELADEVERLRAALQEVEGIADHLTKVSLPSVRRIAKIRTIARRALDGEA